MNDDGENRCGFCFNDSLALRNLFVHETRKSFAVFHCLFTFPAAWCLGGQTVFYRNVNIFHFCSNQMLLPKIYEFKSLWRLLMVVLIELVCSPPCNQSCKQHCFRLSLLIWKWKIFYLIHEIQNNCFEDSRYCISILDLELWVNQLQKRAESEIRNYDWYQSIMR